MAQKAKGTKTVNTPLAHGVGRRKKAVARVWVRRGSGVVKINGKLYDEYFTVPMSRLKVLEPFKVVTTGASYDYDITVLGGGFHSQADAIKLGIARAMVSQDEGIRSALRHEGLLTVDDRVKERKKYGQRGARRKFQFVKR